MLSKIIAAWSVIFRSPHRTRSNQPFESASSQETRLRRLLPAQFPIPQMTAFQVCTIPQVQTRISQISLLGIVVWLLKISLLTF